MKYTLKELDNGIAIRSNTGKNVDPKKSRRITTVDSLQEAEAWIRLREKGMIIMLFLAFALTSCTKEKCYDCTTTLTVSAPGISPQVSSSTFDFCGNRAEVEGSIDSQTTVGGITATSRQRTTCRIK